MREKADGESFEPIGITEYSYNPPGVTKAVRGLLSSVRGISWYPCFESRDEKKICFA